MSLAAPRDQRGFTLAELTVVMVLLAVLSAAAVPSLSGLGSANQGVAATRLRTAVIYAQAWAMASGNDTWVEFDVASELMSVWVEDPSNPGPANRLALTDPLTRKGMTIQLGAGGVELVSADFGGTDEVQFDSIGTPHDASGSPLAADGTVTVTGGGTVRVTKSTGLVTID